MRIKITDIKIKIGKTAAENMHRLHETEINILLTIEKNHILINGFFK